MALKKYQRYLVTAVPIVLVGLIAYYFSGIVTYIILAWVLSMVGAPINNRLRKWIGSTGAAVVTLFSFALLSIVLFWAFIPPIVQQARNLTTVDYEKVIANLEEPLNDWNDWLIRRGILEETVVDSTALIATQEREHSIEVITLDSLILNQDSTQSDINIIVNIPHHSDYKSSDEVNADIHPNDFFGSIRSSLLNFLDPNRITKIFGSVVGVLGNFLITILSVFFIAFFFLKEQGLFTSMIQSLVPDQSEDKWTRALDETANMLMRYFSGIVIQVIVITFFITVILSILGFKNALLIGFFAALMNVIPYVGPILGASFAMFITLSSNLDIDFYSGLLPKLGIIALVFGIMQLIDNFIVQPNIFSRSVKAHPLEIFIIVLAGAKLGGVLGMVIAIPAYTVLRVLAKVFLSEFKIVQSITQEL